MAQMVSTYPLVNFSWCLTPYGYVSDAELEELGAGGFDKTGLREFLKLSGADPDNYSKDSQMKVDEVVKRISKLLKKKVKSSADVQNTSSLLDDLNPTPADFALTGGTDYCNK